MDEVQSIRSVRYTEEDAAALVEEYRDRKMCSTWTLKDAWNARIRANLVSQEEGILDQWSYGRAVLIGDAVHKVGANVSNTMHHTLRTLYG